MDYDPFAMVRLIRKLETTQSELAAYRYAYEHLRAYVVRVNALVHERETADKENEDNQKENENPMGFDNGVADHEVKVEPVTVRTRTEKQADALQETTGLEPTGRETDDCSLTRETKRRLRGKGRPPDIWVEEAHVMDKPRSPEELPDDIQAHVRLSRAHLVFVCGFSFVMGVVTVAVVPKRPISR